MVQGVELLSRVQAEMVALPGKIGLPWGNKGKVLSFFGTFLWLLWGYLFLFLD